MTPRDQLDEIDLYRRYERSYMHAVCSFIF